jgi:hypothetical protein
MRIWCSKGDLLTSQAVSSTDRVSHFSASFLGGRAKTEAKRWSVGVGNVSDY